MSSCEPTSNNLPLYFQSIIPSISPTSDNNTILYATTGSLPSYIPLNRIWNFICNGIFQGPTASVLFDASELIEKCPEFNVTFEGKIYGQLTFGCRDEQVQKHVTSRVVKNNTGRVTGIIFDITKPTRLSQDKTHEFYFNILLNDTNSYNVSIEYGKMGNGNIPGTISYTWDGQYNFQLSYINPEISNLYITLPTAGQQCPIFFLPISIATQFLQTYLNNQSIFYTSLYLYNSSTSSWTGPSSQQFTTPPTPQSNAWSLDFGTINQGYASSYAGCEAIDISWQNCSTIIFEMQSTPATYYFNITNVNPQVATLTFVNYQVVGCNVGTITVVFTAPSGYTLTPSTLSLGQNTQGTITVTSS